MKKTYLFTPAELWDIYRQSVHGKAYDGKELPTWDDAAPSAQQGWVSLAEYVNFWVKKNSGLYG